MSKRIGSGRDFSDECRPAENCRYVDQPQGEAPSLELVRKILAERARAGIEARTLRWSSYFRIHHRQVSRLRIGRLFLAGDAAHIHSPFGGQGMNTGLHDACNLVWKLDLFLGGHGRETLLDSYEAERLPVTKGVIHTTDTLTKVMGTPNRFVQHLRDAFIPMVSRLAPFQHAFVQKLSELDFGYRGSPIVEGPGARYFEIPSVEVTESAAGSCYSSTRIPPPQTRQRSCSNAFGAFWKDESRFAPESR